MSTFSGNIEIRNDTAANWTSNDPTLLAGEFGFENDTGLTKIGDGVTAWTSLPYSGGRSAWTTVTYAGTWAYFGGTTYNDVQYRKVGDTVELRGMAKTTATTAANDTAFTLPVGFRPLYQSIWGVYGQNNGTVGLQRVDVLATGEVRCVAGVTVGGTNFLSLDPIRISTS